MLRFLAQVKLEDVFRHTQENMTSEPEAQRVVALVLGAVAMLALLLVLQYRRYQQAIPKAVNHHGKLLKEVTRGLPLKRAEVNRLKQLAESQSCSNPLVLLLCPSALAKAAQALPAEERKAIAEMVKRMGA